ncbi:nitroreductase [Sphingobium chlorophenolicum L-1]|uniref:Nitroreductase n=1 Tax=Sphingobium chlorophenolicum L-1 TaxID=690566 RepID=F6F328_SPHCR|nr:nitroreductase family protein [Sphingobium chlorophenolicum]AEG50840.1 nitroreductase [Sphingobium chlorophenolicum L-1]
MTLSVEKSAFLDRVADAPEEARLLADLMSKRFSCRAFHPDPVPRKTLEAILNIAQLSASWCNSQAWEVIVTEGAATDRFRKALLESVSRPEGASLQTDFPRPAQYVGRYLERRRETGWQLYEAVGIANGDREGSARQTMNNFHLFGAPHAMVLTSNRDLGVYGAVDTGGYVAGLMLAAKSMGVDTIAQAAIAMQSECVRKFFDIPEDRMIVCGLSVGYGIADHPANSFRTRRDSIEETTRWVSE